jgi:hypothetical protein
VIVLLTRVLPRWLGVTGLAVSAFYLLNQGDVLATAVPGFPIWDLAGLIGSTGWGVWVIALGATVLLRPARARDSSNDDGIGAVDGSAGVSAPEVPFPSATAATAPARASLPD